MLCVSGHIRLSSPSGSIASIPDPKLARLTSEVLWAATEELYCYSREKYDEEQGRA